MPRFLSSRKAPPFIAFAAACLLAAATPGQASEAAVGMAQAHLYAGTLDEGDKQLSQLLAKDPSDAEAIAGLGAIRLAKAVERLSQSLYRYGFRAPKDQVLKMPMFNLPIPENPSPEPIGYEEMRDILKSMVADLEAVDKTLEPLGNKPVKLPLAIGKVRLNLTGDNTRSAATSLYEVYNALLLDGKGPKDMADKLVFAFDTGDVLWLRGYTHLLRAPAEFMLARDWHQAFDATFHTMFAKSKSPIADSLSSPAEMIFSESDAAIGDAIAFIHLINWPVAEKDRLPGFRTHLKEMIALNQQMWSAIRAETDNDREWLPNAKQTSLIPEMSITNERIDTWLGMTVELDALLDGKKMVPHWRFQKGFNLQKLLESDQPFDLVMLIVGAGAAPYLEDGPKTDMRVWGLIEGAFGGDFLTYAAWIN